MTQLSQPLVWTAPFLGMLSSIALGSSIAPRLWHRHFGKVSAFWIGTLMLPFGFVHGLYATSHLLLQTVLVEYLPFIILLSTLYTVAGGIHLYTSVRATPLINTITLALGTALASVMGTTGASMLLIRPLLRANAQRRHTKHVVIFFIFLVANIGGALTPLGDPPLFLGFLNGVGFFWTTVHLLKPMLMLCAVLLALFYWLDRYYFQEDEMPFDPIISPIGTARILRIQGKINVALLLAVLVCVLLSGVWTPGTAFEILGVKIAWQNLLRDVGLIILLLLSLRFTPPCLRTANVFDWAPMIEVAKLFIAIFITLTPIVDLLHLGEHGPFAAILRVVSDESAHPIPLMYFWVTGVLSSFLDNAPTYLVFFNLLGGDALQAMQQNATTLAAISAGAVFMGANTYIGNAPNLMIKSIATIQGVQMPSFLGYMGWVSVVLLPAFLIISWIFFSI